MSVPCSWWIPIIDAHLEREGIWGRQEAGERSASFRWMPVRAAPVICLQGMAAEAPRAAHPPACPGPCRPSVDGPSPCLPQCFSSENVCVFGGVGRGGDRHRNWLGAAKGLSREDTGSQLHLSDFRGPSPADGSCSQGGLFLITHLREERMSHPRGGFKQGLNHRVPGNASQG